MSTLLSALWTPTPPLGRRVGVHRRGGSDEGATILPPVGGPRPEAVWLGMRVVGTGRFGTAPTGCASQVGPSVTGVEGLGTPRPTLDHHTGKTEVGFTSSDGFDAGDGYRQTPPPLPADAHR